MNSQEQIRQRAQEIWEREGRPEGRDVEHWLQAEAELRERTVQPQGNGTASSSSSPPGPAATATALGGAAGAGKEEAGRKRSLRRAR